MKFIGLKHLWYGDVISEAVTPTTLKTWLATATEVKNSHDGTFSYEQGDPEITDYKNEITGNTYHRDKTSNGEKTIKFSIGEYDFETKAALQGGSLVKVGSDIVGWAAPDDMSIVNKAIASMDKQGNYVVFTYADIVGKTEMQEKNMTLGITATALDNPTDGVADEYWFSADAMATE